MCIYIYIHMLMGFNAGFLGICIRVYIYINLRVGFSIQVIFMGCGERGE